MKDDPKEVWGPKFWYVFHTYADAYSERPSDLEKEVAKNLIRIIPFMLPCTDCAFPAYVYIKTRNKDIDQIVSSRYDLVKFFHDFHNDVNIRTGKRPFIMNLPARV